MVTGVSAGTAQITAAAAGKTGQATVAVTAPPVLTTLTAALALPSVTLGQTTTATASGRDQFSATIATGAVTWSTASSGVATVGATSGIVTGVAAGTTTITATVGGRTATVSVTVTEPPAIRINEVESNGGVPGDWVELINTTTAPIDVSGWGFRDKDTTRLFYVIPAGTVLPAGGYYLLEEAQFNFGLGANDVARLVNQFGGAVDLYQWTVHATVTYGRCPNGSGPFVQTLSTKGVVNNCSGAPPPPPVPTGLPWPGTDNVTAVDGVNVFGGNLSGLIFEGQTSGSPNVLWGVRNGPGSLFRLVFSGGIWTPDPTNGWVAGKALRYPDNAGDVDAEGVTFTTGSSAGMYVSAERNNLSNGVSRISVLRYDVGVTSTTMSATNEWNLTADYPDHGTGIFFVGLESNGVIHAYALNHTSNTFTRIATFPTGFPAGVMDLSYDRTTGYLWAICDDTCGGLSAIFEIDRATASPTRGRFLAPRRFLRPSTMPNLNNEGFTVTPHSQCVAGFKPVFWADDGETGGRAIRTASIPCGFISSGIR